MFPGEVSSDVDYEEFETELFLLLDEGVLSSAHFLCHNKVLLQHQVFRLPVAGGLIVVVAVDKSYTQHTT